MYFNSTKFTPAERQTVQKLCISLLECLRDAPEPSPPTIPKRRRGRPKGSTKSAIAAGRKNLGWHHGSWRLEVVRRGIRYRRSLRTKSLSEAQTLRDAYLKSLDIPAPGKPELAGYPDSTSLTPRGWETES